MICITIRELTEHMRNGREIEFSYDSHPYFLAPLFQGDRFADKYYIYDVCAEKNIFCGCTEEVLRFEFACGKTFLNAFECFCFDYIL